MKGYYSVEVELQSCSFTIIDGIEQKEVSESTTVFADALSVNRAEFYAAPQAGYRADIVFELWADDYAGQQGVTYDGKEYRVIRSYATSIDRVQLTCQRMEGLWISQQPSQP